MITLIWAQDSKGGIGKDNKIPWYVKEDLEMFKAVTLNKVVVMGYTTYLSIGKPLVDRKNIVLTKNHTSSIQHITTYTDIDKLLDDFKNKDLYIIGGRSIYQQFIDKADRLIVSEIPGNFKCDKFMDFIDWTQFKLIGSKQHETFKVSIYDSIRFINRYK